MSNGILLLIITFYSFALWLGTYLIARNPREPRLVFTGCGLTAYALALGLHALSPYPKEVLLSKILAQVEVLFFALPALFWLGTTISLLPEDHRLRPTLRRRWAFGYLPFIGLVYLARVGLALSEGAPATLQTALTILFGVSVLLPLLASVGLLALNVQRGKPQKPFVTLVVVALFFGLGTALVLFPVFGWLSSVWGVLGIGVDLLLLGGVIAVLDALDAGELLLPDFIYSFDATFLAVLVFGGLVGQVIVFGTGVNFAMLVLLLGIIMAAILWQTFSDQIALLLDMVAFASFPQLQRARGELRVASKSLPKVNPNTFNPHELDEGEFTRLTRKALRYYGDMSRLASSPLTRMPLIDAMLADQGAPDETLERAAALKQLLTESIERLKPRDKGDFGTSDEWRYYNALYFPYVVGLKPYSRRADHNGLDPVADQALAWFRTVVPERTLYNWQTTAAALIAQDLRERLKGNA